MSSSANNEPQDKLKAQKSLLKYDIQPLDESFSARILLNNLSSVDKYLLNHAITFEQDKKINSINWDYIRPQTAYNYISLNGKNAPSNLVNKDGIVFTFNNVNDGVWQLVMSTTGIAYRKIDSPYGWDYIGQGIPGDIDIHTLIDQHHLNKFKDYISELYVSNDQLKSVTNSQEVTNFSLFNSASRNSASLSHDASSLSNGVSSLSSSTNSQLNSPNGILHQTSNNAVNATNSLSDKDEGEINDIYSSLVPSYTSSELNSLTGSFSVSNNVSNYAQFTSGIYGRVQSMSSINGFQQLNPGSVYINASLINSEYNQENKDSNSINSDLDNNIIPSLKANTSYAASSDAKKVVIPLSESTSNDKTSLYNHLSLLSSSASSDAQVTNINGYNNNKNLLSVSSDITVSNGPTILGSGYSDNLTSFTSTEDSNTTSVLANATSLAVSAASSFNNYQINTYNLQPNFNFSPTNQMESVAASQSDSNCNSARSEELAQINSARSSVGMQPLHFAYENQIIADLRIPEEKYVYEKTSNHSDKTIHGEDKYKSYANLLGSLLNYNSFINNYGENAGSWEYGHIKEQAIGSSHVETYNNQNGKDVADHKMDVYLNHDDPNWGHRHNILNPNYRYIGISYYYDPNAQEGVEVDEFSANTDTSLTVPDPIGIIPISNHNLIAYKDHTNPAYLSYVTQNKISFSSNKQYQLSALVNNNQGVIGLSNSSYLNYFDNPLTLPENNNGYLIGKYGTYLISHNDLVNQVNNGYISINFVPSSNVDSLNIVGIPVSNNTITTYKDISINSQTPITNTQKVNSLASDNANNITYLNNKLTNANNIIDHFEENMDSYNAKILSNSNELDSLSNNPIMSGVPTKSMASVASTTEPNITMFIYPRFTQPTGDNSRTEEDIINWCESNGLGMLSQDFMSTANSNTFQYPTESQLEYQHRKDNLVRQIININKNKVAAILGIVKTKNDFGTGGTSNYLGYRYYNNECNSVYSYFTQILGQTIGGWNYFKGSVSIVNNTLQVTGIQNTSPRDLAVWLDNEIDSSNNDSSACGSNAESLRSILY